MRTSHDKNIQSMSGEFDSRKHPQSRKFEQRPRIL